MTPPFAVFAAMHAIRLFGNRNYAMLVLRDGTGRIAHSSMVFPPFARFPFMAPGDLQIGATFTQPDQRGQGLALRAIEEIVARFGPETETFWYLTAKSNAASQAVIRKAGFAYVGSGSKRPRFGSRLLGYYCLDSVASDDQGILS